MESVKIGEKEVSVDDMLTELEAEIERIETLIESSETRSHSLKSGTS